MIIFIVDYIFIAVIIALDLRPLNRAIIYDADRHIESNLQKNIKKFSNFI